MRLLDANMKREAFHWALLIALKSGSRIANEGEVADCVARMCSRFACPDSKWGMSLGLLCRVSRYQLASSSLHLTHGIRMVNTR